MDASRLHSHPLLPPPPAPASTPAHCPFLPSPSPPLWRRPPSLSLQQHLPSCILPSFAPPRRASRRAHIVVVAHAALVHDIAAVAVAAAAVLPMCWLYIHKTVSSGSSASSSPSSASASSSSSSSSSSSASSASVCNGFAAALEAAGLPSATAFTDATAASSSRIAGRSTTNGCASSMGQLQSHSPARRSSDASAEGGWSSANRDEIGYCSSATLGESGTRSLKFGIQIVSAASTSVATVVEHEVDDAESTTGDSLPPESAIPSEHSGLLLELGVNGWSNSDLDTDRESEPDSSAKKSQVNGVSTAGGYHADLLASSRASGTKDESDCLRLFNREESKTVTDVQDSSAGVNSVPPVSKDLFELDNLDDTTFAAKTVREKLDELLLRDSTEAGLKRQLELQGVEVAPGDLNDRLNGSGIPSTAAPGKDSFWEPMGNDGLCLSAGQNGAALGPPSEPRTFKKRRRKQRSDVLLTDLLDRLRHFLHHEQIEDPAEYLTFYNKLLGSGRIGDCLDLLESMDKVGILDTNKVYHAKFFRICQRQQAVKEAFRFMKLIQNPSRSTFNMLLSVCCSAEDLDGAFQVFGLLKEAELQADCMLYTTLISTCAKAGKVDSLFKVFHEMVNAGVEPNVNTYGALIDGCARAGQIGKAFGVYGILRSKKVKPDRVIFNSLITACGRSGALERAIDVFAEMKAEPIPVLPDHVTFGALIKACAHAGQVDRALEVYKLMQEKGIRGTAKVYTQAVHACSQNGDLDLAFSIYNDMKKNFVQADEVFFSALIDVAGHAKNIDAAFQILHEMEGTEIKAGRIVYSSLMGVCNKMGNWERAMDLYKQIRAAGILPTVSTFNALITVLCGSEHLKESLRIVNEMRQCGIKPNEITYGALFEACDKTDDIDTALDLYEKAASDGVTTTMAICDSITSLCLQQVQKADSSTLGAWNGGTAHGKWLSWALTVYRQIVSSGLVPTIDVFSQVLGCLRLPATSPGNAYDDYRPFQIGKANQQSLIDGFTVYDPRALRLFEEASSLGVVPSFSYTNGPITVKSDAMPVFVLEVCLLTLLKGYKHRHAAGANLPPVTIYATVEKIVVISKRGQKDISVTSRAGQAAAALLRRLRLSFHGHESSGKLRITAAAIRRWLCPKPEMRTYSLSMQQLDSGPLHTLIGKGIAEQQRRIRLDEAPRSSPNLVASLNHRPFLANTQQQ